MLANKKNGQILKCMSHTCFVGISIFIEENRIVSS